MSGKTPAPEEQARANFYGLLARLFYAPPDRELLETLAVAGELAAEGGSSPLALAWTELRRAAAAADPEAVREEYETVFVGTGKAEVTLYTGAYTARNASHNPLVDIRGYLAAHQLARREEASEPEDHIAALCDVMRHLVASADVAAQREFFEKYLSPASGPLCNAVIQCERAGFYGHVARFAKMFFALEHSAYEMD